MTTLTVTKLQPCHNSNLEYEEMSNRKEGLNFSFYLLPCDKEIEQKQKKKFIFSLLSVLLAGKLYFLRLVGPLVCKGVSEHRSVRVPYIFRSPSVLYYLLLDKSNERIERKKKEGKKERSELLSMYSQVSVNGIH
jgi:hypothetical protein